MDLFSLFVPDCKYRIIVQQILFNFWNFAHLCDLFDSVGRICYLLPTQLFGTLELLPFWCVLNKVFLDPSEWSVCMKLKSLENKLIFVDITLRKDF